MPDIAMCINIECPIRDNCYRYRAIPSQYLQSYSKFEKTNCIHHLALDIGGYIPPLMPLEDADENAVKLNKYSLS